jgi:putative addiction module component (TIGR02574 family)|nr:addiction module protein [uncultured Desulfuromonas sp.]
MLAEDIEKNALKLDVIKRIHLVERLLESLDKTDPEVEKIWVAESEKRYLAYRDGRIEGIPLEQIVKNISR